MTEPFDERDAAFGHDEYVDAALRRLLAEDSDIADLSIEISCREDVVVLRGEVESPLRREQIARLVAARLPGRRVLNHISVARVAPPAEAEELS